MKKVLVIFLVFCMALGMLFAGGTSESADKVKLTFSSWRTEDVPVYEELISMFEAENPGISVTYRPYKTEEYQTVLAANFKGGSAADIIHLRACGNFEQFAQPGYLLPLTKDNIPELEMYSKQSLAGSTSINDGKVYGVPYASQSLVIYYNTALYEELGLKAPKTWAEFMSNLEACKKAGVTPLANGSYTGWMVEVMSGIVGPNFFGGNEFYEELISGKTDFTDVRYQKALEAVASLTPYMPKGFTGLDYVEQQMLFINDMAAHFLGGIWEASYFASQNPDLKFDIFVAPPLKEGDKTLISTYMDGSFGINKASAHQEEAIKFVRFLAQEKAQQFLSDKLGVKTEHPDVVPSSSFLKKVSDPSLSTVPYIMLVGFRYEQPTGSSLVQTGLQALLSGEYDSKRVVNEIQEGVAQYYKPFQK